MQKPTGRKPSEYGPCERDLALWLTDGLMADHGRYDQKKLKAVCRALKMHPSKVYGLANGVRHFLIDEVPAIAAALKIRVPPSCRW